VSGVGALAAALPLADPDEGRIAALRRAPAGETQPAAMKELEVVFLSQLLAAMRKTVPESDFLPRAAAHTVYEGMFDRTVAETMAQGDPLGLVERAGDGLKIRDERADRPAGNRHEATVRVLSDEDP
jgi:Rod binding domain-containing protein